MHGNRRTIPRGTDMDEFPLSRMRRRKKANRGEILSARRDMPSNIGLFLGGDILLARVRRNSICIVYDR